VIASWNGGYDACVPAAWIPTSPEAGETYYYQDAGHQMGLLILDDVSNWTRDTLRAAVFATAATEGSGMLQELTWPVSGETFDLMMYSGLRNGSEVLYQHFYRALPEGGALQVLVYSAASDAWKASAMAAQFFSKLRLSEPAELQAAALPKDER
jgi:hypothetical protein